jgi:hypothetical protein
MPPVAMLSYLPAGVLVITAGSQIMLPPAISCQPSYAGHLMPAILCRPSCVVLGVVLTILCWPSMPAILCWPSCADHLVPAILCRPSCADHLVPAILCHPSPCQPSYATHTCRDATSIPGNTPLAHPSTFILSHIPLILVPTTQYT